MQLIRRQTSDNASFNKLTKHMENAGIAQLVEHDLAKVGVASSSLVSRSNISPRDKPDKPD